MRNTCLISAICIFLGCGSSETTSTPLIVELVTVKDSQGREKQIPSSELYASTQDDLAVKEILVLDRQTNKQLFVQLNEIPTATQSTARYIPVTTSQTEPSADRK